MNIYACTHIYTQVHLLLHDVFGHQSVSGLNATDRAPIYVVPLTFAFRGYGA